MLTVTLVNSKTANNNNNTAFLLLFAYAMCLCDVGLVVTIIVVVAFIVPFHCHVGMAIEPCSINLLDLYSRAARQH